MRKMLNNMENDTKIIQIVADTWTGRDGTTKTDVLGLGEDGLMYKWHRGTGKWVLNVIVDR